jgi:hypothetical protein
MAPGKTLHSNPLQLELQSRSASPNPVWLGLLLPSVTDLIFIVLLAALTFGALAPRLLGDAGIGWHIRNGQQMLATHSVTRVDSFSSSKSGQPWYAWEWLSDLAIAQIHSSLGLNGVVFFTALVIATSFALLFRLTLSRGGSLPVTVVFVVLAVCASAIHLFARPHVLSWLFTVIWFQILDSSETAPAGNRRLFWLPLLMVLWVNVHGGFLLGLALLGLYLLAGCFRLFGRRGENTSGAPEVKQLAALTTLTALVSLVNPYGYKLHLHVYGYLTNRFMMNHIDEFHSPDFHGVAQQCFAALLLITIVALASTRERIRASQLLVVLFAAYSGFYASRNLPTSSLLLTLVAAPMLSQSVAEAATQRESVAWLRRLFARLQSFSQRMGSIEQGCRGHLWPLAAALLGLVVCTQNGRLGSFQLIDAHFDANRFPVETAAFIARSSIREPIFAPDYWGGFLIYRFYPEMKVVIDDRHDFYGEQFLKNYLNVIHAEPGWESSLEKMQSNWVLAPAGSTLVNILKENSKWKIVYEDKTAVMFESGPRTSDLGP